MANWNLGPSDEELEEALRMALTHRCGICDENHDSTRRRRVNLYYDEVGVVTPEMWSLLGARQPGRSQD